MYFKELFEETSAGDIAQGTGQGFGKMRKQKRKRLCEKCQAELNESPVGSVGRTGAADAESHVTDALKKEFKALIKKLGGLTVARTLLNTYSIRTNIAEGNSEELTEAKMSSKEIKEFHNMLSYFQDNCNSNKLEAAIDEVMDLLDTEC